ncbi:MAG: MgtC/SapB family protein [bacterium]|nr:MgtC/SapB family protein [bacterium]
MDFIVRCIISIFLGGVIGLERELKRKPAGLKTHILICVGSTALTFLSSQFSITGDPGRIAAQIVSGIGFIGAGTILQSKQIVQGLTTAATLWLVASTGMLVGANFLLPAFFVTFLVLPFLLFSKIFTSKKLQEVSYCLNIEICDNYALKEINKMLNEFDISIHKKNIIKKDNIYLELNYTANSLTQHIFIKRIFDLDGIGEVIKI